MGDPDGTSRAAEGPGGPTPLSARITVHDQLDWTADTHVLVSASEPGTGIDILVVPVS